MKNLTPLLIILLLIIFFFTTCKKENNDKVIIKNRIEFSKSNYIKKELKLITLEKTINLSSIDYLDQPDSENQLEFIVDNNSEIVFIRKNFEVLIDDKISSNSTVLFMATLNTTFNKLENEQKNKVINHILNNDIFKEATLFLDNQEIINIKDEEFKKLFKS